MKAIIVNVQFTPYFLPPQQTFRFYQRISSMQNLFATWSDQFAYVHCYAIFNSRPVCGIF